MTPIRPQVSVVIPLLNEEGNVEALHRELTASLSSLGRPYEILMVDDGSTDGTLRRLQEIETADRRVRVLRLRRNFGQTAAFSAGFDHARGDIVVTSDGDLQNDPQDIPRLVNKLDEGFDMVCGWRVSRQDPMSKRLPSWFANRLISWATGVRLHDYGCSLKAMRVEVVRGIKLYGEMHRFIPAVASWMGVSVAEMQVNHRARTHGTSKYGIGRTVRVLLDLFTVKFLLAYGTRPAHLFGLWGLTSGFAGFAVMAYLTWLKLARDEAIGGRPLLLLGALLFVTGVVLVSVGLLSELLVRIYHESQGKPTYMVKEIPPLDAPAAAAAALPGPVTRVLFLTESYHPVLGGGEQHIRALTSRLSERGFGCTVITRRTDAQCPAEETDGAVRVVRVSPSGFGRAGKYRMVLPAIRALWSERRGFDVLVVRGTRVLGLPGFLAARLLGKRVVLQPEVNGEMSGEVYTWGTRFDRAPWRTLVRAAVRLRNLLMRRADAFVAMSRLIRDEAAAAGVPPQRIAHLPHGIDLARFRPADSAKRAALRERLDLPADGLLLVYTGRLLRGKGLETLVEAFARVTSAFPAALLVIVGSGDGQSLSVEAALREDVRIRGLDARVRFTGRVDSVEDWLRASDVFVFPSVFEALGLSLVEAAACGLACVATRTGGIPDVIEDGRTGLLVPPGDATALAEALTRVMSSPELRGSLGEAAAVDARARFDAEASVGSYAALFDQLARRGAA